MYFVYMQYSTCSASWNNLRQSGVLITLRQFALFFVVRFEGHAGYNQIMIAQKLDFCLDPLSIFLLLLFNFLSVLTTLTHRAFYIFTLHLLPPPLSIQ